jgi:hypothetical protein
MRSSRSGRRSGGGSDSEADVRPRCSPLCDHAVWQTEEGARLRVCELDDKVLEDTECLLRDLIMASDEGAGLLYEDEYEWMLDDLDDDAVGEFQEAMLREIRRRGLKGVINQRYLDMICGGDIELYWEEDV